MMVLDGDSSRSYVVPVSRTFAIKDWAISSIPDLGRGEVPVVIAFPETGVVVLGVEDGRGVRAISPQSFVEDYQSS